MKGNPQSLIHHSFLHKYQQRA
uniref:Uncharacterized protein n=1 Tax=Rhizophora mucronata TaxID=61149 RepID=A0A2P2QIA3_RHIMU